MEFPKLGTKNPFVEIAEWDPNRSPRWRFDRAAYLAKTRANRRTYDYARDDEYIADAFKFLKSYRRLTRASESSSEQTRVRKMYNQFPEMWFAYDLFNNGGFLRFEVESRILARMTDEEVAVASNVHPTAVHWYEKLFFNVRDRLDRRGYIGRKIIGPAIAKGLRDITPDFSWKYWGYFAGPYVLNYVIDTYDPSVPQPKMGADLNGFFDQHFNKSSRRRSCDAVDAFEVNQFNVMQLFEIHANLINQSRMAEEAAGGAQTPLEDVLGGVMSAVEWTVGRRRQDALESSAIGEFTGHAAEMRASEMMAVASGEQLNLEHVKTIKFPEPRESDNENAQQGS